jgi:hypothetical protein
MKPYLYILAVLLVGGGVGFFLGKRSFAPEQSARSIPKSPQDERQAIEVILQRQREAYSLHDPLLLFRDCASTYVEVDATTGASYDLQGAVLRYHAAFQAGKSVAFNLTNPDITILQRCAFVRAQYAKTSDQYEQEGFKGWVGQGIWLLSYSNGQWEINAFAWNEEKKL